MWLQILHKCCLVQIMSWYNGSESDEYRLVHINGHEVVLQSLKIDGERHTFHNVYDNMLHAKTMEEIDVPRDEAVPSDSSSWLVTAQSFWSITGITDGLSKACVRVSAEENSSQWKIKK